MVSTVLRNIQSEMFVIRNLRYIGVSFIKMYADVIWDNNITYLVDKIEKVQMEAARIVTGDTRVVSLNNLCLETGWDKLKNRRERIDRSARLDSFR
jgi:hypothetical protein